MRVPARTGRPWRSAFVLGTGLGLGVLSARGLDAGFAPPRRVTDGSGKATQTATGVDLSNNAYIASVVDEKIVVRIIGPDLDVDVTVPVTGIGQGDPDFATNSRGVTYLSFTQLSPAAPGEGREIYVTKNEGGGGFQNPLNVSRNRVDDFAPKLVLDRRGEPRLVWAQRVQTETRVLYWHMDLAAGEPLVVAAGEFPALFLNEAGVAHVVYARSNDLYYNAAVDGRFDPAREIRVTTTPFEPETVPSIGGDSFGNILISYESRSTLYFTTKKGSEASFRPPRNIDAGQVQDPMMRTKFSGQLRIAYTKGGDVHFVSGLSTQILPIRTRVELTEAVESRPSIEVDQVQNLHLSYIREGEVYYTNNAVAPTADFSADPRSGEWPLEVRFGNLTGGPVQVWEWDFGDGATGHGPQPVHSYLEPGKYTVRLRVKSAGAVESTVAKEDFIVVLDRQNWMRIPDQKVHAGQKGVWFPVLATHAEPIQAFQVMGTYDPNVLTLNAFELSYTAVKLVAPDFVASKDGGSYFWFASIFDFPNCPSAPCKLRNLVLPPGENQTLVNLVFDVSASVSEGTQTQVELVNDRALSEIINIFTVDSASRFPVLVSSNVEVLADPGSGSGLFQRGDANSSGTIDITDAVKVLGYLFLGDGDLPCPDAADFNDRGSVDISGAIAILNYLFLGGPQPAVPFPNLGLDPNPDRLEDCEPTA